MNVLIEILVGIVLALVCILLAKKIFPNRIDKVWQQGLLIAALIYVVFALFGENPKWILIECGGVLLYGLFVFLAIRKSILFLSLGWGLHVLWDLLIHPRGMVEHVPIWYPNVCLGFDLVIAGYFLWFFFKKNEEHLDI